MPTTITEADTFTATLQVPNDTELADQASLLLFLQGLSNRSRYLYNRVDLLLDAAAYTLSGTPAAGAVFTLTQNFADGAFSVASNQITVPAAGTYFAFFSGNFSCSDLTSGVEIEVSLRLATAVIGEGATCRYSTTSADRVCLSAMGLAVVTNPATEKIDVMAGAFTLGTLTPTNARLLLLRRS